MWGIPNIRVVQRTARHNPGRISVEPNEAILSAVGTETLDYKHSDGGRSEVESCMEIGSANSDTSLDSTLCQESLVSMLIVTISLFFCRRIVLWCRPSKI